MVSQSKRSPIRDAAANQRDSLLMFSIHAGDSALVDTIQRKRVTTSA